MGVGTKSALLLEEHFEHGDDRFLEALFECVADKPLKALAPRWYRDPRPWARKMLKAYVDDGCDRPRHRALVRALLRIAEDEGDDELMAHFLHAFDGLVRHELKMVRRWSWQTGQVVEGLAKVPTVPDPKRLNDPAYYELFRAAPKKASFRERRPDFTGRTRHYLRRRAFRYFRELAWDEPERFAEAALYAMARYGESDVAEPIHVVDSRGITQLLYYGSDVLERTGRGLRIAPGRQLKELEPAPINPDALRGRAEALLRLLFRSESLFVRRWITRWLEREEPDALAALSAEQLKPLLMSPHGDVQVFAASLIDRVDGFGRFRIEDWLDLLELDNLDVLPKICALVEQHVTPDRWSDAQLVRLATLRAAPVAELGLGWLRDRPVGSTEDMDLRMQLADAEADDVRADAVAWLMEHVEGEHGTMAHLRALLDARHPDVREVALAHFGQSERYGGVPELWLALSESPYPEVSAFLVQHLEAREELIPKGNVERVWASVLLSPFRGSRAKRRALRQIATRVVAEPARADELLPILRVALRSVREAERRAALAQVARAAFEAPALEAKLHEHVPELELSP